VRLYKAARNDVHRICVLLGTYAALGQREIASLRRDEFDLAAGILTHRRSKTGQLGKFWLPPEAVKLIRRYFREVRTDKENTAFFTAEGSRLVTDSSDAVRQAWTDIVDRVNEEKGKKIEKLVQGFYALRKFAADYAMQHGGPIVRDTFLAHAPESVGAKHYSNTRDFKPVFAVGQALHAELKATGAFDWRASGLIPAWTGTTQPALLRGRRKIRSSSRS
jgi:integrase